MKVHARKRSRVRQRPKLTAATVESVNLRGSRLRSERGEIFKCSADKSEGLLPGDKVQGKIRMFRGERSLSFGPAGVERRKESQVVLRVNRRSRTSRSAPILEPVGILLSGAIRLPEEFEEYAHDQHLVASVSRKWVGSRSSTEWRVKKIVGNLTGRCEIAVAVALSRYGIQDCWPAGAQKELEAAADGCMSFEAGRRKDLRDLAFVTVDPASARDHDDAVFCKRTRSDEFRLWVAIADVAHHVKTGTILDRTASTRGTSIYFPCSSVPMLPPELSSDTCSLKPEKDRLVLVCEMRVSAIGAVIGYEFYEAVIRSRARLAYEEVENMRWEPGWPKDIVANIRSLFAVHDAFLNAKVARGALNLDIPEADFEFDSDGRVNSVAKTQRLSSHSLIEEAMLAANTCAAKFVDRHYPNAGMYRIHDPPKQEDLYFINRLLKEIGIRHQLTPDSTLVDYQLIHEELKSRNANLFSAMQMHLLRSFQMAVYSAEKHPHFALNYPEYTHFTSPIRRYTDLIVHRLIKRVLNSGSTVPERSELVSVASQSSLAERQAANCAREAEGWLKAEYMKSQISRTFDGVIADVRSFGIFVRLDDPYVDGMVHVSDLGYDYFEFEPDSNRLTGEMTGKRFAIGDSLRVRVSGADPELGHVNFELA